MIDRAKDRITGFRYDIEDEDNSWHEEVIHFVSKVGVNITSPRGAGPRSSRQIYRVNAPSAVDLESVVIGLMFWEPDLPFSSSLRSEMKEWQHYWSCKEPNQLSVNLSECLSHADEDIFPNILTILKIGCTLPIGSCESERSFSCLSRVKSYLRSTMGQERLSRLALMNMHHSMDINLDYICLKFIEKTKEECFQLCDI
ncbi:52 kDa repressor of the inhibitor of the protein kinase-like [Oopsacas minuta]|uniref:52 kDa repressor of the inhibitor of the protein kinase-like n=1 Tax=Oopsacas minuta TaxID=111878 RepID=A0AAV7JGW5_9METZ|nr:52 kDa repressor of the inhibitor of the protein kinase-like [Oopsacas minuta]